LPEKQKMKLLRKGISHDHSNLKSVEKSQISSN